MLAIFAVFPSAVFKLSPTFKSEAGTHFPSNKMDARLLLSAGKLEQKKKLEAGI